MLIHAAAGGVGHLAVQIARHHGAYMIGTARADRREWLTTLGADEVVDYTAMQFEDAITEIDLVVDLVGDSHDNTSVRSAKVVNSGGLIIAVPGGVSPELSSVAKARNVRVTSFAVEPDGQGLSRIADLIDSREVTVQVDEIFSLERAGDAHARGETGRARGKLVLRVVP